MTATLRPVRFITIGSAMIDIIALIGKDDIEKVSFTNAITAFLLVEPGRKIEAKKIFTNVGGGAINTAVSMKRLGGDGAAMVRIGDDFDGKKITQFLEKHDIATRLIITDAAQQTGSAVLITAHDYNNAIYTYRGANTAFIAAEFAAKIFLDVDVLHICPLSGRSANHLPRIIQQARAQPNVFISVNPGIRQMTAHATKLFSLVAQINLLACNAVEAGVLAQAIAHFLHEDISEHSIKKRHVDINTACKLLHTGAPVGTTGQTIDVLWLMQVLLKQGLEYGLITDGSNGAYLYSKSGIWYQPSLLSKGIRGTAGAGDAYISTVVYLLNTGLAPELVVAYAAMNAVNVIEHLDTHSGLSSLANLQLQRDENTPSPQFISFTHTPG